MKKHFSITLLLGLVLSVAALADKRNEQPQPAVLSAKSVSFITFANGQNAADLKDQAAGFFRKWNRYRVVNDPTKADLVILVGPMPRHVSGDAWDAVLAGKPSPVPVDAAGAQSQFAVFDGSEIHGSDAGGPLKPVWSTEMNGNDVKSAAKKYRRLVENTQESYDHMGLTFDKCRMVGLRCSH